MEAYECIGVRRMLISDIGECVQRGVLYVTDKRIIWVGDGNPPSHAVSICLESISKIVPFKWSMLSSSTPRVKLHLHIDTNSLPTSGVCCALFVVFGL